MRLLYKRYSYSNIPEAIGFKNVANGIRMGLEEAGVEIVNADAVPREAPGLVLHVAPPHRFAPLPFKHNLLYSMWETESMPPYLVDRIRHADTHVVPSQFCVEIWKRHGLGEPAIVHPGISETFFKTNPWRPVITTGSSNLRFMYLGSRSPRKGWDTLAKAWGKVFTPLDAASLYVKTGGGGDKEIAAHFNGKIIIDRRYLDVLSLARLYVSHHVFVFPSYAEGLGLPALEAMACGCLVIAPNDHGLSEFINDQTALVIPRSTMGLLDYGTNAGANMIAKPLHGWKDVAKMLRLAYKKWGAPMLERKRLAGVEVARTFTWEKTTEEMLNIIAELPDTGKTVPKKGAA